MVKYDLLLCSNIFYDCYLMPKLGYQIDDDEINMNQVIRKHRLVLSNDLLRIYKAYAKEKGFPTAYNHFSDWYNAQAYMVSSKDFFIHVFDKETDTDNIDDVISSTIKDRNVKRPIIVCGMCPKCLKFVNAIKPIKVIISNNILDETIDNELRRNMMPFSTETTKHESAQLYVEWFKEMLSDQKHIKVFNRYAYKTDEFNVLNDYILRQTMQGSIVDIYLDHREGGTPRSDIVRRNELLRQLAIEKQCKFTVYDYDHENRTNRVSYHDRRIFLEKDFIKFTAGFNSLPALAKSNEIKNGNLEISHKECDVEEKVNSILNDHPGYYEFWNSGRASNDIGLKN